MPNPFLHRYFPFYIRSIFISIYAQIFLNVTEYWNERHLENVCFITYEEMKNDLASVIRKVSTFLSRPVAEENIPSLVDHLSFDKMKKNKSVNKQEFVEVGCIENDHTSHKMLKA